MSPYRMEMTVIRYTEKKEPVYIVRVYSNKGNTMLTSKEMSKVEAVKCIAEYCGVTL